MIKTVKIFHDKIIKLIIIQNLIPVVGELQRLNEIQEFCTCTLSALLKAA